MKSKTTLLFRADGNSRIGLGHVIRCLALAELLNHEFSCSFVIQGPSEALQTQIKTVSDNLIILPETTTETDLIKEAETLGETLTGHEIIILDGYQFSTLYQQILKQKGSVLVCLDDLHDRHFVADAIINIAGGVIPKNYSTALYTKLCIGPQYALFRQPFREAQKTLPTCTEKVPRILICFGGADPDNFTLHYANKILNLEASVQLEIVTGSAYQHTEDLQRFLTGKPYINWHKNLSAEAMAGLMQNCAAAICSASSVAYEYCAVTGMLFVEKTAANQADLYHFLTAEKLALPASALAVLFSDKREVLSSELCRKQREFFNGQAETNLRHLFSQLNLQAQLEFRKVTLNDAQLLFEWANDPEVRRFSFNSDPIPYQTHISWLTGKLANPDTLFLLAEIQEQPAALLRFDLKEGIALISYQIATDFRGKGLGHRVLQVGLKELKNTFPEVVETVGFVQPENIASVRAFEKAEFENLGLENATPKALKFLKKI